MEFNIKSYILYRQVSYQSIIRLYTLVSLLFQPHDMPNRIGSLKKVVRIRRLFSLFPFSTSYVTTTGINFNKFQKEGPYYRPFPYHES